MRIFRICRRCLRSLGNGDIIAGLQKKSSYDTYN
ncbi:MAG: hypothetical protein IJT37_11145 [Lachnospiraceae bacterium]|nr:hypothetical protein [Lachnospiraceae bacterium]